MLPPIDFKPSAFPKDEAQGVVIAVRQLPGYPTAAGMIAQALSVRADRILLDFAAQGVAVRFRVDGAWEICHRWIAPTVTEPYLRSRSSLG